jgi:hypothetical protein
VGRQTLRTVGELLSDMAENTSPDVSAGDIVCRLVSESAQNLIGKLRGRGRKRPAAKSKKKKNKMPAKRIKRDIFS